MTQWPIDSEADQRPPLRRSGNSRIAGVAAGLGQRSGIDANLIRVLFIALAASGGAGFLLYLGAWLLMPPPLDPATGLSIHGPDGQRSTLSTALGGLLVGFGVLLGLLTIDSFRGVPFAIVLLGFAGVVLLNRRPDLFKGPLVTSPMVDQPTPAWPTPTWPAPGLQPSPFSTVGQPVPPPPTPESIDPTWIVTPPPVNQVPAAPAPPDAPADGGMGGDVGGEVGRDVGGEVGGRPQPGGGRHEQDDESNTSTDQDDTAVMETADNPGGAEATSVIESTGHPAAPDGTDESSDDTDVLETSDDTTVLQTADDPGALTGDDTAVLETADDDAGSEATDSTDTDGSEATDDTVTDDDTVTRDTAVTDDPTDAGTAESANADGTGTADDTAVLDTVEAGATDRPGGDGTVDPPVPNGEPAGTSPIDTDPADPTTTDPTDAYNPTRPADTDPADPTTTDPTDAYNPTRPADTDRTATFNSVPAGTGQTTTDPTGTNRLGADRAGAGRSGATTPGGYDPSNFDPARFGVPRYNQNPIGGAYSGQQGTVGGRPHWAVTRTAGETYLAPATRPPGSQLAPITVTAILAVLGVALVLNTLANVFVGAVTVSGIGLAIVGLAIATTSFRGQTLPLIPIAGLLSIALVASPVIDHALRDGTGSREIAVNSAAELAPVYELGVGAIELDLTRVELTEDVELTVDLGTGSIEIRLPPNLTAEIHADVNVGYAEVLGEGRGGINPSLHVLPPVNTDPDAPRLVIRTSLDIGGIDVYRIR